MATKKELTKEQKIKKEIARLKRVFKDLDKNKLQTVESLIKNAAFMAVSLEELQEIINAEGYTVEYQNGENQKGTKQSDAVKTHIAMTKNHASIIKQLTDLVPPEKKKESRLQALGRINAVCKLHLRIFLGHSDGKIYGWQVGSADL